MPATCRHCKRVFGDTTARAVHDCPGDGGGPER